MSAGFKMAFGVATKVMRGCVEGKEKDVAVIYTWPDGTERIRWDVPESRVSVETLEEVPIVSRFAG